MRVIKYALHNMGRFEEVEVELADRDHGNVTVLIGNNGAGKTTLLQGLATSLSWLISRIRSEKGSGSPIGSEKILNGQAFAAIDVMVQEDKGQSGNPDADQATVKNSPIMKIAHCHS